MRAPLQVRDGSLELFYALGNVADAGTDFGDLLGGLVPQTAGSLTALRVWPPHLSVSLFLSPAAVAPGQSRLSLRAESPPLLRPRALHALRLAAH